ncbi:MAG: NOB1 family endonuclease [Promethearchaeota archaeon]
MTVQKRNLILIFDTNIFLIGIDINLIPGKIYTTPLVLNELDVQKYEDKNRPALNRIKAALETKKLLVKSPSKEHIELIKKKAIKTGDLNVLSETDISIIALATEFLKDEKNDVVVCTNDYSMQNLCSELGLKFKSIHRKGISEKRIYETYCPFCGTIYDPEYLDNVCERCGIRLKRRPKK